MRRAALGGSRECRAPRAPQTLADATGVRSVDVSNATADHEQVLTEPVDRPEPVEDRIEMFDGAHG